MEPGSLVDPGTGGVGVELLLGQRADDAHDNEHTEQCDSQPQRGEEPEGRVAFPSIPRRARWAGTGRYHAGLYAKDRLSGVK